MVIRVSEIPEEGLRFEGPEAFPEPFQDREWRLEDVELAVEKDGDVVFGDTADGVRRALASLLQRGIDRAVIQPHVEGDLVKFYGIGVGSGAAGAPPWFRWFYHREQRLAGHPFDAPALARLVRRAATALGLEVYGGDAVITPAGEIVLLDHNAWPSFALFREEAAPRIADYLTARFSLVSR